MSSIFRGVLGAFKLNVEKNYIKIIKNLIRNLSPSQKAPVSFLPPAVSSIFRGVLDALKLNVERWDLACVTIKPYKNKQKHHQEYQPQSGSSSVLLAPTVSSILRGVLDAFKLHVERWDLACRTIKQYQNHKNVIRNLSPSQKALVSSLPPAVSSIIRGVLDNIESWFLACVTIKP